MPLFNKSKKEKGSKAGEAYPKASPYPTQQQSPYPTQPTAPAGVPGDQPPPYTPQGQPAPQYGAPPGAPQYQQQGSNVRPAYYPQQPQYGPPQGGMMYPQMSGAGAYPMHPQIPPGSNVVGHGVFDAGARFNGGAGVNIPPPPPGAMPTAAQYAAAHGGTVTMGQAKSGFFSGGSDGGVSTHID